MPDQAMGVAMTSVPVRAASRMLALPRRLATGLLLASIAAFALPGATAADQNMTSLKLSGFGKELGREALDLYLQTKTVWVDLS